MQTAREQNELRDAQGIAPLATAKSEKERARWLPWVLAIVSGALQIFIFPLPNWTFLCWIALAPLLIALIKAGHELEGHRWPAWKRGFLLGFVSGIVYYAGSCYWIGEVMSNYGGIGGVLSLLILLAF